MTAPGGGGGGFEYSADAVTAKLAVEVPPQALENIHQLQQRTADLRAEIEGVARGMGSWIQYINQLPQAQEKASAAQRTYLSLLQQQSYLQQGMSGTHPASTTGGDRNLVPMGYQDPFGGGAGTGGWLRDTGMMQPGPVAFGPQQAQQYMNQMGQTDPRLAANMQVQRGQAPRPEQIDQLYPDRQSQRQQATQQTQQATEQATATPRTVAQTASGVGAAATSIANEVAAGQSVRGQGQPQAPSAGTPGVPGGSSEGGEPAPGGGAGGAMMEGLLSGMGLGRMGGVAGALGGLPGGAKALGIGGAAAGVGMGLNRVVQNAGEQMQQYRNIGAIKGGGATEGLGYEMQSMQMALNPFITAEQSRVIIQSALREGYTGKEFDTVTGFVAENLKHMNMDISESFALARTGVVEGKASFEDLNVTLEGLKERSKDAKMSLDDMTAGFEANLGAMVSGGASGSQATAAAETFTTAFKDNQMLAPLGERLGTSAVSPQTALRLGQRAGISGMLPEAIPGAMGEQYPVELGNMLRDLAKRYSGMGANGIALFARQANQMVPGMIPVGPTGQPDQAVAAELMKELLKGNPFEAAAQEGKETRERVGDRNLLEQGLGAFRSVGEGVFGTIGTLAKGVTGQDVDYGKELGGVWNRAEKWTQPHSNSMVDTLINQYGAGGLEVVGTDGKTFGLDTHNKEMMERLASGMYKYRPKGSDQEPQTAREGVAAAGGQGATFKNDVKVSGEVKITVDQQGRVSAPQSVKLTANQVNSMYGAGRSTMNNPSPGDR